MDLKNKMSRLHIYQDNLKIAEVSPESGNRVIVLFGDEVADDVRTKVFEVIGENSNFDLEKFKKSCKDSGFEIITNDQNDTNGDAESNEKNKIYKREASFLHESNLIEGISEIKYDTIFDNLSKNKFGGHVSAWRYIKALGLQKTKLKPEYLNKIHQLITDEQVKNGHPLRPEFRGNIRTGNTLVQIGGRIVMPPEPGEFSQFFEDLNKKLEDLNSNDLNSILEFAADNHFDYEYMHPYADGNGRTGRLIVNYILSFFGYEPLIITNHDKHRYYQCFAESGGNKEKMRKFFIDKYNENNKDF